MQEGSSVIEWKRQSGNQVSIHECQVQMTKIYNRKDHGKKSFLICFQILPIINVSDDALTQHCAFLLKVEAVALILIGYCR